MPSIIIPDNLFQSCEQLLQFFTEQRAFFTVAGRRFEAYRSSSGYELVTRDQVEAKFRYVQSKKVTDEFFGRCIYLLEASPVKFAVENPQKLGTSLPHYLFWLVAKEATPSALKASDASDVCGADYSSDSTTLEFLHAQKQSDVSRVHEAPVVAQALAQSSAVDAAQHIFAACTSSATNTTLSLHHAPSAPSLWYSVALAAGCREEKLPMQARLILEVPTSTSLNSDQLECVLHFFAEPAWHYFKTLSTEFESELSSYNYFYNHLEDPDASLDLLVRHVADDLPYKISLINMFFDELLFSSNVEHLMRGLVGASKPLDFTKDQVKILYKVKPLSCKELDVSAYLLTLSVFKNTCDGVYYVNAEGFFFDQFAKINLLESHSIAYLPEVHAFDEQDVILQQFYKAPIHLHEISQQSYVQWQLNASIATLNAASYSLLRRVQEKEAFTLPASAEVIASMKHIMVYLLDLNAADKRFVKRLVNADSFKCLTDVRNRFREYEALENLEACTDSDQRLKSELAFLYQCCDALSNPEHFATFRTRFLNKYKVEYYVQHNIAYPAHETASVITHFLGLLARIYKRALPYYSIFCNLLISRGILPQFMLQSHVTLPSLNKLSCFSLGLVGVSFDKDNFHDGLNYSVDLLWMHDYLGHIYKSNNIIDAHWKHSQNSYRQTVMHNVEQVRERLLEECFEPIQFLGEKIKAHDLLIAFDLLTFLFTHELSPLPTQTRTRILPIAFPHTYLEKTRSYFQAIVDYPSEVLSLNSSYMDYPKSFKNLLPLAKNSPYPFFAAYELFDAIVVQTRNAISHASELPVGALLSIFRENMSHQERLLHTYAQNWDTLLEKGILFKQFAHVKSYSKRLKALAKPHLQERLRASIIDWPIDLDVQSQVPQGSRGSFISFVTRKLDFLRSRS